MSDKLHSLDGINLKEVSPEPEPENSADEKSHIHRLHTRSSIVKALRGIQKYSAFGILAFAGLHLTSTVALPPFSLGWANSSFMAARSIYQNDIGELSLVYGSLGLHITSGAILHVYRMWHHYADLGEFNWRLYSTNMVKSGWALVALTSLHLAAMRWGPLQKLGDSSLISLDYVSYGLRTRPFIVTASLLALSAAFFIHAVPGISRYLRVRLSNLSKYAVISGSFLWTVASLLSLRRLEVSQGWITDQFSLAYYYIDLL